MWAVNIGDMNRKTCLLLTLRKPEQNFLKKAAPKKIEKFLFVKIHDIIKPIPDFIARPKNWQSFKCVCKWDQVKFFNYQNDGKIVIPEDFQRALNSI